MSKTAVVVFSDPENGGDEALGRLLNAMFLVSELKEKGQEVALVFQGTGTRWIARIIRPDHPANGMFKALEEQIAGVCGGCADVFGAAEDVEAAGLELVRERDIPGTSGIIDLSRYLEAGYRLLTF